ncbi:MAG: leucyl aminopeptidase family protein [Bacteroidota bacterium]|nr:leucyl aminopeptidase family protein [Bacteroidota bacterium]
MNLSITYLAEPTPDKSVVYIIHPDYPIEQLSFTKTEAAYIREQVKSNKNLIHINSYFKHSFVLVIADKYTNDNREKLRNQGNEICEMVNTHKVSHLLIDDCTDIEFAWQDLTESIALSNYQFTKHIKKPQKNTLTQLEIFSSQADKTKINSLTATLEGVYFARDLVNEPHSHLNALNFPEVLKTKFKNTSLTLDILHLKQLESLKMGGLLAVNKGSETGPSFSIVEWKPAEPINSKPIVLVGKGVMFDTGGLSIKSAKGMEDMKSDMAGAAAVAGTMLNLARADSTYHVIGLIPATDNRPGKNAYLPQDVIYMHDGTSVEVLNTDAEGRMILADALSYAKQYKPQLVIELSTLTGSAEIAVGIKAIAAMGNTNDNMETLKKAGFACYERIAELPFWDDYKTLLISDIAELKNVGSNNAGAITAGKFLEHFTDYPFIHLDIAGPAFLETTDSYRGKNGTGVGVRLLNEFFYLSKQKY